MLAPVPDVDINPFMKMTLIIPVRRTSAKELGNGDCDAIDVEAEIPTEAPVMEFEDYPINAEGCARISCSNNCYRGDQFLDPDYDFTCGSFLVHTAFPCLPSPSNVR